MLLFSMVQTLWPYYCLPQCNVFSPCEADNARSSTGWQGLLPQLGLPTWQDCGWWRIPSIVEVPPVPPPKVQEEAKVQYQKHRTWPTWTLRALQPTWSWLPARVPWPATKLLWPSKRRRCRCASSDGLDGPPLETRSWKSGPFAKTWTCTRCGWSSSRCYPSSAPTSFWHLGASLHQSLGVRCRTSPIQRRIDAFNSQEGWPTYSSGNEGDRLTRYGGQDLPRNFTAKTGGLYSSTAFSVWRIPWTTNPVRNSASPQLQPCYCGFEAVHRNSFCGR